jgi:hypothetical protein
LRVGAWAGNQGGGQETDGGPKSFYGHNLSFVQCEQTFW